MVSAKQVGRWRPAFRQQTRWKRSALSLQMSENLLNDRWVFDAGDHFHRAAAFTTGLDVDAEYSLRKCRASSSKRDGGIIFRVSCVNGISRQYSLQASTHQRWMANRKRYFLKHPVTDNPN